MLGRGRGFSFAFFDQARGRKQGAKEEKEEEAKDEKPTPPKNTSRPVSPTSSNANPPNEGASSRDSRLELKVESEILKAMHPHLWQNEANRIALSRLSGGVTMSRSSAMSSFSNTPPPPPLRDQTTNAPPRPQIATDQETLRFPPRQVQGSGRSRQNAEEEEEQDPISPEGIGAWARETVSLMQTGSLPPAPARSRGVASSSSSTTTSTTKKTSTARGIVSERHPSALDNLEDIPKDRFARPTNGNQKVGSALVARDEKKEKEEDEEEDENKDKTPSRERRRKGSERDRQRKRRRHVSMREGRWRPEREGNNSGYDSSSSVGSSSSTSSSASSSSSLSSSSSRLSKGSNLNSEDEEEGHSMGESFSVMGLDEGDEARPRKRASSSSSSSSSRFRSSRRSNADYDSDERSMADGFSVMGIDEEDATRPRRRNAREASPARSFASHRSSESDSSRSRHRSRHSSGGRGGVSPTRKRSENVSDYIGVIIGDHPEAQEVEEQTMESMRRNEAIKRIQAGMTPKVRSVLEELQYLPDDKETSEEMLAQIVSILLKEDTHNNNNNNERNQVVQRRRRRDGAASTIQGEDYGSEDEDGDEDDEDLTNGYPLSYADSWMPCTSVQMERLRALGNPNPRRRCWACEAGFREACTSTSQWKNLDTIFRDNVGTADWVSLSVNMSKYYEVMIRKPCNDNREPGTLPLPKWKPREIFEHFFSHIQSPYVDKNRDLYYLNEIENKIFNFGLFQQNKSMPWVISVNEKSLKCFLSVLNTKQRFMTLDPNKCVGGRGSTTYGGGGYEGILGINPNKPRTGESRDHPSYMIEAAV